MRVLALWVGLLVVPTVALGQSPRGFEALAERVRVGDIVYVTDRVTGAEVSGPLAALTSDRLTVDGQIFEPRNLIVERRGDALWEGLGVGFGVGLLAGVTVGSEACLDRSRLRCALIGGGIYAALGALIDAAHVGRTTVFQSGGSSRFAVRPLVLWSRRGVGIAVSR